VTLKQWIDLDEATRGKLLNLDPTTVPRRGCSATSCPTSTRKSSC
jgi:hypothetical protein